ncbi:MAG: hypothetical protein R6U44_10015 [Archaeoglobaceae archaeon]
MKKIGFVGIAMLLMLASTALAMAAPPDGDVEPEALYNLAMEFDPYSVSTYEETIAYGETENGPVPPSLAYMWYFALLVDGDLAEPTLVSTNLPSYEIVYHSDCDVISGGAWEIVETGWGYGTPIKMWAKLETYATSSGTYVGKAGADPEHGGTFGSNWATGYLYVE